MKKNNNANYQGELYIGLMSGTSMDAIDAALVEFLPNRTINLIAAHSSILPQALKDKILSLCGNCKNGVSLLGKTDTELGIAFATCCMELLKKSDINPNRVTAIGSHGQAILHAPNDTLPFTIQIGDPNIIATMTNITTIADFRRRDLALGGQGAPLAPAFHRYLFGSETADRIILNIGGIANLTFLAKNPDAPVIGFDTGPGNTLLDAWCWQHQRQRFDDQGKWAASGTINTELLKKLLEDEYFKRRTPKSADRGYFDLDWLARHNINSNTADVQATLTELTANSIAKAIEQTCESACDIFVCGGGAHNTFLLQRLQQQLPKHLINSTATLGLHPNWVEAVTFAWLAKQTINNKPGNLPSVTGAKKSSVIGAIYPAVP